TEVARIVPEADKTDCESFIEELATSGVLIAGFEPRITGTDPFADVALEMSRCGTAGAGELIAARREMAELEQCELGTGSESLQKLEER
ncbi:lantibiotic dehydratase, partial [Acinetobacter baumannii]